MLNLQLCSKINDLEDLGTTASVVPLGFDLMFLSRGYRTGIANCILTMIDAFENIPNESTFMMAKDLVKGMYFRAISNSSRLTWGYLLKLKDPDYQTYAEELDTLNSCGFSDFCNFIIQFKNQMVFVTLSIGRITREEEQNLGDRLEQIRTHTRYMEEFYITKEKAVEQGTKCLRLKSVLDIDKVYAVLNFYEADASTSSNYYMIIIIFRGLLRPAFHQLRTVEQLGYLVKMNLYFDLTNDKVGFSILVGRHIEKHCPCYIDSRIDNFLDSFYTTGLEEIAKKYEHLLKIFEQTTDTLKAFYKEYFLSGGSSQAKLTIQVVTCRNDKECICQNAAKMTPLCKKFRWAAPIHWVGPQKAELVLAKDLYTDDTLSIIEQFSNPSYFIDNIDEYHGSKNNSSG